MFKLPLALTRAGGVNGFKPSATSRIARAVVPIAKQRRLTLRCSRATTTGFASLRRRPSSNVERPLFGDEVLDRYFSSGSQGALRARGRRSGPAAVAGASPVLRS